MRHTFHLTLLVALVAVWSMPLAGAPAAKQTFEGELVDSACFVTMDAKGPKHATCAAKCMTAGFPAGILTAAGKFHILLVPATALADYAGAQARVTGTLDEKSNTIDASKIEAQKNGKWETVKLPEMPM